MPLVYFDSSALVKLLRREDGSEVAAVLWDQCDAALASRLALVEVSAALGAARRRHDLTAAQERASRRRWSHLWAYVRAVELRAPIAVHASALAARHGLAGADAVHLASALAADGPVVMAAWDARLREASISERLAVAPASL